MYRRSLTSSGSHEYIVPKIKEVPEETFDLPDLGGEGYDNSSTLDPTYKSAQETEWEENKEKRRQEEEERERKKNKPYDPGWDRQNFAGVVPDLTKLNIK
jgi:hypothetical protein